MSRPPGVSRDTERPWTPNGSTFGSFAQDDAWPGPPACRFHIAALGCPHEAECVALPGCSDFAAAVLVPYAIATLIHRPPPAPGEPPE